MQIRTQVGVEEVAGVVGVVRVGDGPADDEGGGGDGVVAGGVVWAGAVAEAD